MKSWLQSVKREHIITMLLTMGMVAISTAAQAAGAPVPGWQAMGNMMDSVQGVPMIAAGTGMVIGSCVTLGRGDIGLGTKQIALAVGATGLGCNVVGAFGAWGVAGALA